MKYNIGDTVYLEGKIAEAIVNKNGASYYIRIKGPVSMTSCGWEDVVFRKEDALADIDAVPLEVYEKEVNRLKGLIEELRRMP